MSAKAISEQTGKEFLYKHIQHPPAASPRPAAVQNRFYSVWTPCRPRLVVKPDQLIKRRGKLGLVGVDLDLQGVRDWLRSRMMKETTIGKAKGILKKFLIEPVLASFILGLFNLYEDLYFTYLEINPLVVTQEGVYVLDMAAKIDATADFICKAKWGDVEFPPPFGREAYPEEAYIADLDAKSGASLKLTLLNPRGRIWTMVAGGGASVVYSDTICDLGGVDELANYGEYSGAPSEQQTYDYAKTILSLMTREKHPDGKVLIIGGSIANFTNVAATFKGIVRAIKDYQGPLKEHEVTIFVRRGGPNYQEGLRVMGEVGKTTGIPIHVFGTETHMTAIVGMALGHRPIPNQPPVAAHTANFLLNSSSSAATPATTRTSSFSEHRPNCDMTPAKKPKPGVPPAERSEINYLSLTPSPSISLSFCLFHALCLALCLYFCLSLHLSLSLSVSLAKATTLFSKHTKSMVWGMQTRAVQGMLDFDYVCSRDEPSVSALVYPFTGDHKQKFYWGHKEILLPVYKNMADAMKKHPEVDVLISFASLRSAFDSTMETMNYPQIHTIAIIAEGIPEALTRKLIKTADQKGVTIIGPATVGGIKPGCFKIGNTGGMLDNILASKLYRPGSVAYVSRSGGMSNELNNIISRATDGVYEGVAIGGDRYPGSTFMDHVLRYQDTPDVKMIVVLGEVKRICDERGQELIYAGMPITEVFKEEMGLGGVLGLLWFQRRVQILKDFVKQHFPATQLLDYALDVEKITTSKKRLKQGLYRHPWDDISYVLPEHMSM
ncbi:ATP-citrate synthase [Bagarius yarrelli]|uniref:ATP-citrate synthase n=1 Tax=Bagarius yarrelli TaxID=175774 RepID=A0A556VVH8_BAGYA|nr:ATP-citrate synthase [Bagarius yarrelli]